MSMFQFAGIGSHWSAGLVAVTNQLQVDAFWQVNNLGAADAQVYMELEVRRQLPNPALLVATLPGLGQFITQVPAGQILSSNSPASTVLAGQTQMGVSAQVVISALALKDAVLDIALRLRQVVNPNSNTPDGVGPVIADGLHSQAGVVGVVVSPALQAFGLPTMSPS